MRDFEEVNCSAARTYRHVIHAAQWTNRAPWFEPDTFANGALNKDDGATIAAAAAAAAATRAQANRVRLSK
jgi:hypothetical protein